jgi:muramoyltetrapeptide carboxypeptidase
VLSKTKSKPTIKARALKKGNKVALVAPASRPESPAVVARCERLLTSLGLQPIVGEHVLSIQGFLAGNDRQRLSDLNAFIHDESVRAIFCLTGGYGCLRLLEGIDYDAIAESRKLFIGADDCTCLLNAIYARTGMISLQAPNADQVKSEFTYDKLKEALFSSKPLETICALPKDAAPPFKGQDFYCAFDGVAEGRLIGGNLTAYTSLLGTDFEPSAQDSLLFLEDINEKNGNLDRWFTSLYLSGQLQYANAVIAGSFENCSGRDAPNCLSIVDLFGDRLKYLRKPSCFGMPFGQQTDTSVIPIGVRAKVNCTTGTLEFLEPALS